LGAWSKSAMNRWLCDTLGWRAAQLDVFWLEGLRKYYIICTL
jgi:hypothetical protein